jgi:hypothetical protein
MKKFLLLSFAALLFAGGCNKNDENVETPPHAVSTQTWTFGDQIWSDAIRIPECNKSDFIDSYTSPSPDCRSYTSGSTTWYYYNWFYVAAHASALCPSPWRVPTDEDLKTLTRVCTGAVLTSQWGIPGYAYGSLVDNMENGFYWSATEYATDYAYYMAFGTGGALTYFSNKLYGYQVRCVQ